MKTICSVEAIPGTPRLRIGFSDGDRLVDFGPVIAQGGVFEPLADDSFFREVRVDPSGRFLEWPGEIDFCADALWEQSLPLGEMHEGSSPNTR